MTTSKADATKAEASRVAAGIVDKHMESFARKSTAAKSDSPVENIVNGGLANFAMQSRENKMKGSEKTAKLKRIAAENAGKTKVKLTKERGRKDEQLRDVVDEKAM